MPDDVLNNFWYVNNASDTVLVFIHGILSDSRGCWLYADTNSNKRIFWPDLVRKDFRFNNSSIFLAGYHTSVRSGDFALADCSAEVFDALERPGHDGTPPVLACQSIIFIGHSTGGIVARYIVERHQDMFRHKAVGLVLMASPSLGSRWANLLGPLIWYENQHLGRQLQRGNESLTELDGRFRDLLNRKEKLMPLLFGTEAYEHKLIWRNSLIGWLLWLIPNRGKIVSRLSAGCYFGRATEIPDTDHFSIVKPTTFNHPSHNFLVTSYSRFLKFLNDNDQFKGAQRSNAPVLLPPDPDPKEPLQVGIDSIRRELLTAKSLNDLRICKARALAFVGQQNEQSDLLLLRDQIDDAIKSEMDSEKRRFVEDKRLFVARASIGTAALLLLLVGLAGPGRILEALTDRFIGETKGQVFISSISNDMALTGDSEVNLSGRITEIGKHDYLYILRQSTPDGWTASRVPVDKNGAWAANFGIGADFTPSRPETVLVRTLITRVPLEKQQVGTSYNGMVQISARRLSEIIGKQSDDIRVHVRPNIRITIDTPQSGSTVEPNGEFFVAGTAKGLFPGSCLYIVHRSMNRPDDVASHLLNLDSSGKWTGSFATWDKHPLISRGENELAVVALDPTDCSGREKGYDESNVVARSPTYKIYVK